LALPETKRKTTRRRRPRRATLSDTLLLGAFLFAAGPWPLLSREFGITHGPSVNVYVLNAITSVLSILLGFNHAIDLLIDLVARLQLLRDVLRSAFNDK